MKNYITKNLTALLSACAVLVFGLLIGHYALAQTPSDTIPTSQEYLQLFSSLQGIGGLKAASIIALIVQAAMLGVRQFVQGKYKLLIVSALTLIGATVSAYISGGGFASVLTNTVVLASVQVFVNQIFTQIKAPA